MIFSGSNLFGVGRCAAVGAAVAVLLLGVSAMVRGADSGDPWPQSVQGLPTPKPTATALPAPTSMPAENAETPKRQNAETGREPAAGSSTTQNAEFRIQHSPVPHPPTPKPQPPTPTPPPDAWPEQIREVTPPRVSPSPMKPAVLAPLVIAKNTPTPDANWPQTTVETPKRPNASPTPNVQQPTPVESGVRSQESGANAEPQNSKLITHNSPVTPTPDPAWPQNPPPKAEEWQKVLERASKTATQPDGTTGASVVTVPVLDAGLIHVSLDGQPAGVAKTGSGWEIGTPVSAAPNLVFTLDPKVKGYRTLDIQVHPALNQLPDTRAGLVWVTREASRGFQPGQRASLSRPPAGVAVLGPDGKAAPRAELEPGRTYVARFTVSAVENPVTLTVRFTTEKK